MCINGPQIVRRTLIRHTTNCFIVPGFTAAAHLPSSTSTCTFYSCFQAVIVQAYTHAYIGPSQHPSFLDPLSRQAACFRITPAPYEKAQVSEEICKRAAHPGSKLNQKKVSCWTCLCVCMPACIYIYVCICAYVLEMNVSYECK